MNRINCNVIKDLLPSYIDDICSEDSKRLVEEHIKECNACQSLVEMMTATELVSEHTDDRQIDYMKKVRWDYTKRNIVSFGLVIMCLLAGLMMWINNYRFATVNLYYCYILIVPVIMTGACLMLSPQGTKGKHAKWEPIMGGIGILLMFYCIALKFFVVYNVGEVEIRLLGRGVAPERMGPLLSWRLEAVIGLQLIMLMIAVIAGLKTGKFHGILIDIHVSGCCMAFAFRLILARLTTLEQFKEMWNRAFWIVLSEGIFIAVIVVLLERKREAKLSINR